jgi:hypothetical protein
MYERTSSGAEGRSLPRLLAVTVRHSDAKGPGQ